MLHDRKSADAKLTSSSAVILKGLEIICENYQQLEGAAIHNISNHRVILIGICKTYRFLTYNIRLTSGGRRELVDLRDEPAAKSFIFWTVWRI